MRGAIALQARRAWIQTHACATRSRGDAPRGGELREYLAARGSIDCVGLRAGGRSPSEVRGQLRYDTMYTCIERACSGIPCTCYLLVVHTCTCYTVFCLVGGLGSEARRSPLIAAVLSNRTVVIEGPARLDGSGKRRGQTSLPHGGLGCILAPPACIVAHSDWRCRRSCQIPLALVLVRRCGVAYCLFCTGGTCAQRRWVFLRIRMFPSVCCIHLVCNPAFGFGRFLTEAAPIDGSTCIVCYVVVVGLLLRSRGMSPISPKSRPNHFLNHCS